MAQKTTHTLCNVVMVDVKPPSIRTLAQADSTEVVLFGFECLVLGLGNAEEPFEFMTASGGSSQIRESTPMHGSMIMLTLFTLWASSTWIVQMPARLLIEIEFRHVFNYMAASALDGIHVQSQQPQHGASMQRPLLFWVTTAPDEKRMTESPRLASRRSLARVPGSRLAAWSSSVVSSCSSPAA